MSNLITSYSPLRDISCPLIGVTTFDPTEVLEAVQLHETERGNGIVQWDLARGLTAVNARGDQVVAAITGGKDARQMTKGPQGAIDMLVLASTKMPTGAVLAMHNAHRLINEPSIAQAIWNMRDPNVAENRALILMGPVLELPAQLAQDVWILDDPLPDREELASMIAREYSSRGFTLPSDEDGMQQARRALDALRGLPMFTASQAVALNLTKTGLDVKAIWDRKRQAIRGIRGLRSVVTSDRFSNIIGMDNLKGYLFDTLCGERAPRAVLIYDEIEKELGNPSGDTSRVSQEMHGAFLKFTENNNIFCVLIVGPAGTGKTHLAHCLGNEAPGGSIETIEVSLSEMKEGLVGASTANQLAAQKMMLAVSDNQPLLYATCNNPDELSRELRSRFKATFFVDFPSPELQQDIFLAKCREYELPEPTDTEIPDLTGWAGREIRNCVETSWRHKKPHLTTAGYVIPTGLDTEYLDAIRTKAVNRYVSADVPGLYTKGSPEVTTLRRQRATR